MWPLFYPSDMHFLTAKTTKQTALLLPLEIPFSEWACDVTQVKKRWECSIGEITFLQWFIYNLSLWVLGLAVSNINESQLQTYESKTLFLMTSLQFYCIPGLAGTRWNKNLCAKDAGCAGNKITVLGENSLLHYTTTPAAWPPCWNI